MSLSRLAMLAGVIIIAVNLVAVLSPAAFMKAVKAFPRSRVPAWVLIALDLFWVTLIIHNANLGRFQYLKTFVYAAGPISFLLIAIFLDELLAPRALGGLLLLAANPFLNAARWHESGWRTVVTVLAYAWVVAGIVLVLSPYRFRQVAGFVNKTESRCRWFGAARMALGAFVLYLGLAVY